MSYRRARPLYRLASDLNAQACKQGAGDAIISTYAVSRISEMHASGATIV